MRFFSTNVLFTNFGGISSASSSTALAYLAFDEENDLQWTSVSEGTDGDSVYLERILSQAVNINRIFVKETNINNLTIEVDIGAGYVSLSSASTFTLTKSSDGANYFYELDSTISISKIKFTGSNTIVANSEKTVKQFLAFEEIGELKNFNDLQPKRERIQKVSKLNAGKFDIINKGRQWAFKIKLKSHYNSSDNTLIDNILQNSNEFWVWPNNKNENIIVMTQEPYRFQDIYKVAFQKSDSVQFMKNCYFSGIDVTFDLVEVA